MEHNAAKKTDQLHNNCNVRNNRTDFQWQKDNYALLKWLLKWVVFCALRISIYYYK